MGHGVGGVYHSLWPQGVENSSSLAEGGGGGSEGFKLLVASRFKGSCSSCSEENSPMVPNLHPKQH